MRLETTLSQLIHFYLVCLLVTPALNNIFILENDYFIVDIQYTCCFYNRLYIIFTITENYST